MFVRKICLANLIFLSFFLLSCASQSKKNNNLLVSPTKNRNYISAQIKSPLSKENELIKELTGKNPSTIPTQAQLKNRPLSTQHYYAGLRALESKNYIKAIKHFNTVLKKHPKSAEVQLAYIEKAKIYNEMGLTEPAELNRQLANSKNRKSISKDKKVSEGNQTLKR